MTAYNGNMIYYDGLTTLGSFKVGNPTTYYNGTAWTFTWEHGRQLATMTSGSTTWTNTYNSDGLRTSRTDGTTTYTYIYENGRLSAIKRNDLNMWIIYDDNGPVTLKYGSGTFHYVTNPQGDVVAIVGNQGQKLVEYTYDAWGKVTSITGDYAYNLGVHNPILYRGYIYDHEIGLYYCQSRYYDPQTHRFLNADAFASTGQGLIGNNMFAYCGNNPIIYTDPSGHAFTDIFAVCFDGVATPKVVTSSDHQAQSDILLQYILESYLPSNGCSPSASVEYLGVYSKQSSLGLDAAFFLIGEVTSYLGTMSGWGTIPTLLIKGAGRAASIYGGVSLISGLKDELAGLANKDYEQYKVVISWAQFDSSPGSVRRTDYRAEMVFLWNDTRKGMEHWYVQDYSASISQEYFCFGGR